MPPPTIDEITTFTEAQKQELKRKSARNKGVTNESEQVEQIKEMYRILFPDRALPGSFYVRDNGPQPEQEHQADLTTAIAKILSEKVPMEARYAGLASQLQSLKETCNGTAAVTG
ncbi:hypothetical protein EJ04DRAFT_571284 [Polyplosphaeria fusca]|uniref:Uncharacterized protein n=1 Tax=Polyplosphaeria fusca TaxID=682080 RepID=A0A9P4QIL5_9PLEO|nr:hypothetical protein EJ04DRAFT_571284 [Polyplosphaeria fusca]